MTNTIVIQYIVLFCIHCKEVRPSQECPLYDTNLITIVPQALNIVTSVKVGEVARDISDHSTVMQIIYIFNKNFCIYPLSHDKFEFRVFFLLDWLPYKAKKPSIPYYLTIIRVKI